MKRLIIICEGPTEQAFCNSVLSPYFITRDIIIDTPVIKRSAGGLVSWESLKKQIEIHLKSDSTAHVSMLIDYYGIKDRHGFPQWEQEKQTPDKKARITNLEQAMKADIPDSLAYRFIPYIQLHEFEGLLFSDFDAFRTCLPPEQADLAAIERIIADFPNPEEINDSLQTAPSKRLEAHISGYNKVLYGSILAESIGLPKIREKCSRFNQWIEKLTTV